MSKVDDLLLAGAVVQDPEREDRVIFNVPIYIKKSVVNADGFEMFANGNGWTPDSEHTAIDFSVMVVWGFVRDQFRKAIKLIAEAQAEAQANDLMS